MKFALKPPLLFLFPWVRSLELHVGEYCLHCSQSTLADFSHNCSFSRLCAISASAVRLENTTALIPPLSDIDHYFLHSPQNCYMSTGMARVTSHFSQNIEASAVTWCSSSCSRCRWMNERGVKYVRHRLEWSRMVAVLSIEQIDGPGLFRPICFLWPFVQQWNSQTTRAGHHTPPVTPSVF